jgi:hypothetical protein
MGAVGSGCGKGHAGHECDAGTGADQRDQHRLDQHRVLVAGGGMHPGEQCAAVHHRYVGLTANHRHGGVLRFVFDEAQRPSGEECSNAFHPGRDERASRGGERRDGHGARTRAVERSQCGRGGAMSARTTSAWDTSSCPAAVSSTPRPRFWSSGLPTSRPSAASCRDTAGGSAAALPRWPRSCRGVRAHGATATCGPRT